MHFTAAIDFSLSLVLKDRLNDGAFVSVKFSRSFVYYPVP